jgi:enediyne biosynthesis protein E4
VNLWQKIKGSVIPTVTKDYYKLTSMSIRIIFFLLCLCGNSSLRAQTLTRILTSPIANTPGDSRSINWIDVNQDGWIDCFISNGPSGGQNNSLYINDGTGDFTAVTTDTIVRDNKPSDGATFADLDNDGDLDAFVVNWYNINNLLYTNNGSGTFTQAITGNIVTDGGYSETASWGDYDNDGFTDLYVTNSAGLKRNFLYHNNGDGTFTKITSGTLVTDQFDSRSVNWSDIDSDGDLDLFVTNETNQNENIYRNDGAGVFTRLTGGALLTDGRNTMSSSWADYDNDGDMDVFLANDGSSNGLFRNDGSFNFTKIISDTVSNTAAHSFSSAWSDIDNDGDLDLFVTNAFSTSALQVNFLYLNNGIGSFSRVNNTAPATDSSWSYGCAFGDYDNDGFEDLAVATVRFNSVDYPDLLYHNDGNANHWITIQLVGAATNRAAIGTKIRVKAVINGNPVWQMREISAQTSYCGQNDLRAHFGLGDATIIDSIKVEWPVGTVEAFANISANQFITITQGSSAIEENEFDGFISVFPNPAHTQLQIKSGTKINDNLSYEITDLKGAVISSGYISENAINIQSLSKGTYYFRLKINSKMVAKRFIKY